MLCKAGQIGDCLRSLEMIIDVKEKISTETLIKITECVKKIKLDVDYSFMTYLEFQRFNVSYPLLQIRPSYERVEVDSLYALWNGLKHILTVSNTCCPNNAAMLRLTLFCFFKPCTPSLKMDVNGEPCRKSSATGTVFTAVFAIGWIAASSTASKNNSKCKLFTENELRHLCWAALISKCILMEPVRRKNSSPLLKVEEI